MEEIIKHINDTNASYRQPNAGDGGCVISP